MRFRPVADWFVTRDPRDDIALPEVPRESGGAA